MITWRVVVRGPLTDEAETELAHAGIRYVSGHQMPGVVSSSLLLEADDEQAARSLVESIAKPHNFFVYEVRPFAIQVFTEVPSQEAALLETASFDLPDVSVIISEPDGAGTVVFSVIASTVDEALAGAKDKYNALRTSAGLTPREGVEFWLYPPLELLPPAAPIPEHWQLLKQAATRSIATNCSGLSLRPRPHARSTQARLCRS